MYLEEHERLLILPGWYLIHLIIRQSPVLPTQSVQVRGELVVSRVIPCCSEASEGLQHS